MSKRSVQMLLPLWCALLSLYFIWGVWAVHWGTKLSLSLFGGLLLGLWLWRQRRQRPPVSIDLYGLPEQGNIVLVGGDDTPRWLDIDAQWRLLREEVWLNVGNASSLTGLYQHLDEQKRLPECLLLCLNPDRYVHLGALTQALSQWRQEIETVQGVFKKKLPVVVAIVTDLGDDALECFPSLMPGQFCRQPQEARAYLDRQQRQLDGLCARPEGTKGRLSYTSHAAISLGRQWLEESVLPHLLPDKPYAQALTLSGVVWLNSRSVKQDAFWRQLEQRKTGMVASNRISADGQWRQLPNISAGFSRQRYLSHGWRALSQALSAVWLLLLGCWLYSFNHNQAWLGTLQNAHEHYLSFAPEDEPARGDAVVRLKQLQQQLNDHQLYGAPQKMSFGLYRGHLVRPQIHADIKDYERSKRQAQVVRLDTTALFDVGQSQLKSNAKLVLQGVLTWIQANPNKRVLVDGHTDSSGNVEANMRLSFARAESVKNWLVAASTFPETHFTIQGYGDSKAIADNGNEEGRSQNRRVEITLVDMLDQ
ncbi:MAG: OmpA family protein [Neisseriaceae bacterium]|nr:OmpA family protein [Neisseriaceae bacterium]MBP6863591.1 OmpA family protein [Neisseriaceae bacterium]